MAGSIQHTPQDYSLTMNKPLVKLFVSTLRDDMFGIGLYRRSTSVEEDRDVVIVDICRKVGPDFKWAWEQNSGPNLSKPLDQGKNSLLNLSFDLVGALLANQLIYWRSNVHHGRYVSVLKPFQKSDDDRVLHARLILSICVSSPDWILLKYRVALHHHRYRRSLGSCSALLS